LRQVLLEGAGGDLVGKVAELELVVAKEMLLVGGDEGAREFVDLGSGSGTDGLGQGLSFSEFLGRERGRRHGDLRGKGCIFLRCGGCRLCVQKFHQLSRRPPPAFVPDRNKHLFGHATG